MFIVRFLAAVCTVCLYRNEKIYDDKKAIERNDALLVQQGHFIYIKAMRGTPYPEVWVNMGNHVIWGTMGIEGLVVVACIVHVRNGPQ